MPPYPLIQPPFPLQDMKYPQNTYKNTDSIMPQPQRRVFTIKWKHRPVISPKQQALTEKDDG